ncbi:unnamed protein product [Amoebophrya sp. A120]|nr:unnamed protein product [Amoebophrya sp. A120]|eukprot:GSA120T00023199001.1
MADEERERRMLFVSTETVSFNFEKESYEFSRFPFPFLISDVVVFEKPCVTQEINQLYVVRGKGTTLPCDVDLMVKMIPTAKLNMKGERTRLTALRELLIFGLLGPNNKAATKAALDACLVAPLAAYCDKSLNIYVIMEKAQATLGDADADHAAENEGAKVDGEKNQPGAPDEEGDTDSDPSEGEREAPARLSLRKLATMVDISAFIEMWLRNLLYMGYSLSVRHRDLKPDNTAMCGKKNATFKLKNVSVQELLDKKMIYPGTKSFTTAQRQEKGVYDVRFYTAHNAYKLPPGHVVNEIRVKNAGQAERVVNMQNARVTDQVNVTLQPEEGCSGRSESVEIVLGPSVKFLDFGSTKIKSKRKTKRRDNAGTEAYRLTDEDGDHSDSIHTAFVLFDLLGQDDTATGYICDELADQEEWRAVRGRVLQALRKLAGGGTITTRNTKLEQRVNLHYKKFQENCENYKVSPRLQKLVMTLLLPDIDSCKADKALEKILSDDKFNGITTEQLGKHFENAPMFRDIDLDSEAQFRITLGGILAGINGQRHPYLQKFCFEDALPNEVYLDAKALCKVGTKDGRASPSKSRKDVPALSTHVPWSGKIQEAGFWNAELTKYYKTGHHEDLAVSNFPKKAGNNALHGYQKLSMLLEHVHSGLTSYLPHSSR